MNAGDVEPGQIFHPFYIQPVRRVSGVTVVVTVTFTQEFWKVVAKALDAGDLWEFLSTDQMETAMEFRRAMDAAWEANN